MSHYVIKDDCTLWLAEECFAPKMCFLVVLGKFLSGHTQSFNACYIVDWGYNNVYPSLRRAMH